MFWLGPDSCVFLLFLLLWFCLLVSFGLFVWFVLWGFCVCLFVVFFNLMDVNIILLESLLHCIPVKCDCLPQILANFYTNCVRICLPWVGRAATSQPTLLPPTAHFAKVCRGIFSQCGLESPSLHILQWHKEYRNIDKCTELQFLQNLAAPFPSHCF